MGFTRRKFLKSSVVGAASIVAAPYVISNSKAAESISFVTWGGRYRRNIEKAFTHPFTEETGIEVVISDTPDMAVVRAQVQSGNVQWDVFDAVGQQAAAGQNEDLWEPLDKSIVDTDNLTGPVTDHIVGFYIWSGGIMWVPSRHEGSEVPMNFRQLWDTNRFPGRRAFRARAYENLEIALLADGTDPQDLYPLDVERAFSSLNRIKDSVANWVSATPQTIELLRTNEVDYSYGYSGRVVAAQDDGIDIDMSLEQTINGTEYLTALRGTRKREAAMRFIDFCLRPDRQAEFSELMIYHPVRGSALANIAEPARRWLPDLEAPQNILLDDLWWGENDAVVSERFQEWMLT